jgi:TolA-binding protein
MFNNISDILKSFTQAQRIAALLILVFTIVLVSLGPSIIDSNTNTCDELNIRLLSQATQLKAQEAQILQLTSRINTLNTDLVQGQSECTANLIQKQQEIMGLVNGMIEETQRKAALAGRHRDQMMKVRPDQGNGSGDGELAYSRAPEPEPVPAIDETLPKLRQLKAQIQKTMKSK